MRHNPKIVVVGGGLAGSEAAWQIAQRGIPVELFEMRPVRPTEAHKTEQCAELVCSNSFGSDSAHSASRILKDEITGLGSFILQNARQFAVPAGASLSVDRDLFSKAITARLAAHPLITIRREEFSEFLPDQVYVVATGPLTSPALSEALRQKVGGESLYFYDAISPIVSADSLDMSKLYFANRWDKGETPDFLNCPLDKEQYETLVDDLLTGDVVLPHDFEEEKYFEGCMPIEAIAARGRKTLSFGPLRPVGLRNPHTGLRPWAVIQLRTENQHKTAYNLVGFQTKLKYGEQLRVFRKLPGLENAEFLRLGSMHRNTYLNSPQVLQPTLQLRADANIFIAGQLTGTEGYLESSATGLLAGVNAAKLALGESLITLPETSMLGALTRAITDPTRVPFQPMNANLGVLPPVIKEGEKKLEKAVRNERMSLRSQQALAELAGTIAAGCRAEMPEHGTPL